MPAPVDALINAILSSQTDRAASLVRQGTPVNLPSKHGSTPLYTAAVQGELAIVRLLLEAGADPNQESSGESEGIPLCAAASWGRTEVVRLLLEHGADPNLAERPKDGAMTALRWARRKGHSETAQVLLEAGADEAGY
jgi:ankyrin repeat protein